MKPALTPVLAGSGLFLMIAGLAARWLNLSNNTGRILFLLGIGVLLLSAGTLYDRIRPSNRRPQPDSQSERLSPPQVFGRVLGILFLILGLPLLLVIIICYLLYGLWGLE